MLLILACIRAAPCDATIEPSTPSYSPSAFLLVASQQMADPRFQQTVLVVTRHGKTGPVGIVINRPEDVMLDEVFPAFPAAKKIPVLNGGPVYPGQLSYLVRGAESGSNTLRVSNDTWLGYDTAVLQEMLEGKKPYKDMRVAHGMASWAPGQLEYEIKRGDWTMMPMDDTLIFDAPVKTLWDNLNRRAIHQHEL
jgi:putative AlgH/UPF0301 family transcriptional regulator